MRENMLKYRDIAGKNTMSKNSKGITLIALVISVIVLLILAGVSISAITGNESAMEKAKQARSANEAGGEEDAIKLAVVSAMAKGTYGLVEGPNLANELTGLVTSTDGISTNKSGPWTVQAKNSKIQYEIGQYGTVDKLSGVTVSTATLNLVVGGSATLTATVSEDLSSETLTWHSTNTEVATVENGTVTVKTGATVGATAQIYAKAGATESKNRCTVTVSNALSTATGLVASGSVDQQITITLPANTEDIVSYAYYNDDAKTYVDIRESNTKLYGKAETTGTPAKVTITGKSGATTTVDVTVTEAIKTVTVTSFGELKNSTETQKFKAVKGTGENQQQIVIPAGFKVVEGDKLEDGIVIRNTTDGNEFVWIPVNQTLTFADNSTGSITLGRYSNDTNSSNAYVTTTGVYTPTTTENSAITVGSYNYSENDASVTKFTASARKNKGYYIARYEAGVKGTEEIDSDTEISYTIGSETFTKDNGTESSKLTSKSGMAVWNKISKTNAKTVCEGMYSGHSALMNSYAWDTAIIFIQQCSTTTNHDSYYDRRDGVAPINKTGSKNDEECNISGMASNVLEWTTERSSGTFYPCVNRGGICGSTNYYTAYRSNGNDNAYDLVGFRPLYYL